MLELFLMMFALQTSYYTLRPQRDATFSTTTTPAAATAIFAGVAALALTLSVLDGARLLRPFQAFALLALVALVSAFVGTGVLFVVSVSAMAPLLVSLAWRTVTDSRPQAGELPLARIAAGGTLGSLVGPILAVRLPSFAQLVLSSALLCVVALITIRVSSSSSSSTSSLAAAVGGVSDEPLSLVAFSRLINTTSRHTCRLAMFTLLMSVSTTMQALAFRDALNATTNDVPFVRVREMFAHIDLVTNAITVVLQLLAVDRLLRRVGLRHALLLAPLLAVWLSVMTVFTSSSSSSSLAWLCVCQIARRVVHFALLRVCREALWLGVDASQKRQAKTVIDVFVYRFGEVVAASLCDVTRTLLPADSGNYGAAALLATPAALAWLMSGYVMGLETLAVGPEKPLA